MQNRQSAALDKIMDRKGLKCLRKPGEFIYDFGTGYYTDQLSENDSDKFFNNQIHKYLRKTYNISAKEYCDIIIFDDIDHIQKCEIEGCNNTAEFISLSHGYNHTCNIGKCRDIKVSEGVHNTWESYTPSEKAKRVEVTHSWWYVNDLVHGYGIDIDKIVEMKSRLTFNAFMSQGTDLDECEFYVASTINKEFKFGVSRCAADMGWHKDYTNIKVLYKNTRIKIATHEYLIKLFLNDYSEYQRWDLNSKFRKAYLDTINLNLD